jgi:hypothetical protein
MVHYTCKKTPNVALWYVEPTGIDYEGPRDLIAYSEAAVQYAERLRDLIPRVQEYLSSLD